MKSPRRGNALRKLLTLCDDLRLINGRMADPALRRDTRSKLGRQMRAKSDQLATDLAAYRFKGPLAHAIREFKLERVHFQVLATLLQRHLRADSPAMEGRNVLAAITGDWVVIMLCAIAIPLAIAAAIQVTAVAPLANELIRLRDEVARLKAANGR